MKLRNYQRVSLEAAKSRALSVLTDHPIPASTVADAIWPNHSMHPQVAGAAANRVLKRLEAEGKARWEMKKSALGWVRS